jgi:hypothetical protein
VITYPYMPAFSLYPAHSLIPNVCPSQCSHRDIQTLLEVGSLPVSFEGYMVPAI